MSFLPKVFTVFIIGLIIYSNASGQHNISIDFKPTEVKVRNSFYSSIVLLDARTDTTNLGIVETGVFNRDALVVTKTSLSAQIQNVLVHSAGKIAKAGELLLKLNQIRYAERHTTWRETGFFIFQAAIYAKKNNAYLLLDKIDTVAAVSSTVDVTQPIFKLSNNIVSNFIVRNLTREPQISEPYNYAGLVQNQDRLVFSNYDIDSLSRPKAHSAVSTTEIITYTGIFGLLMLMASHMKK